MIMYIITVVDCGSRLKLMLIISKPQVRTFKKRESAQLSRLTISKLLLSLL
jgi:hypothetical protein